MLNAIKEAEKCIKDVPIGCVIKRNGEIISSAHNRRELDDDVTAHAEILAIKEAQKVLGTSRLKDCELYVTLEPCPMCGWAILQSRIKNLYFGSYDNNYGAFSSKINLREISSSKLNVYGGILESECNELLNNFFSRLRVEK